MSSGDIFGDERLELADLLSHVLDKGVVLKGEVMLAVADIDLVRLDLGLLLTAVETAVRRSEPRPPLFPSLPGVAAPPPPGTKRDDAVLSALSAPRQAAPVALAAVAETLPPRLDADPDKMENGLAKLVLTLIEVLRKVLEHQAVRRMEGGNLSAEEIERLGVALLRLNDRMQDMKGIFGLTDEDLQIDLGPLGKLR
ncbi:MAG TPA: gas vesicle protein GvpJ [Gemmatimonadaceae bacterium]|nr:gas vesicle protein GvpJ [Gemmatimonadaceae bacterium]